MTSFILEKFKALEKLSFPIKSPRLLYISADYITDMVKQNKLISYQKRCFLYLYYTYIAVYMVRLMVSALALNDLIIPKFYLKVDVFIGFLVRHKLLDRYSTLVFWPVFLLFLFLDYVVHFRRGLYSFYLAYDIIVANKKNFFQLNPQLNWLNILNQNCEKVRVTRQPLRYFPALQKSIRQKSVIFSFTFDLIIAVSVLFYALLHTFSFTNLYFYLIWSTVSLGHSLIVMLECLIIMYTVWHGTKIGFFLAHFNGLIIHVLSSQQIIALRIVENLIKKVKRRKLNPSFAYQHLVSSQHHLATFLKTIYLPLHYRQLFNLDRLNVEVCSPCLFLTLLTVFGFSVYSMTILTVMKEVSVKVRALILVANCVVPLITYTAISPQLKISRLMVSTQKYLQWLQLYLGNSTTNDVQLKLKLAAASDCRFAFTVGPVGSVSTEFVLNVRYLYNFLYLKF